MGLGKARPVNAFPSCDTDKNGKTGLKHRAAGGQRLRNVGEKRPHFKTNGQLASMAFQATTDVKKPLAAASKIAAKGNRIVLDDADPIAILKIRHRACASHSRLRTGCTCWRCRSCLFKGRPDEVHALC